MYSREVKIKKDKFSCLCYSLYSSFKYNVNPLLQIAPVHIYINKLMDIEKSNDIHSKKRQNENGLAKRRCLLEKKTTQISAFRIPPFQ